jgi:hypothetical protein
LLQRVSNTLFHAGFFVHTARLGIYLLACQRSSVSHRGPLLRCVERHHHKLNTVFHKNLNVKNKFVCQSNTRQRLPVNRNGSSMRLPPFSVVVVLLFLSAAPYHTDARVHSNHTTRLRLLSSTPVKSTVASIKAAAYGVNRQSCSCANPQAVPLELDSTTRSSNDDEYFTG